MKKRFLNLFFILYTIIVFMVAIPTVASAETHGYLTYSLLSNDTIYIKDCNEEATSVEIPSVIEGYPVKYIGNEAFANCTKLTSVIIPDGVISIGEKAFYNCDELKSIIIPEGETKISNGVFKDCDKLESITLPDSITEIDMRAFDYCPKLTSLTIPKGVKRIFEADAICENLTHINVDEANSVFSSSDGVLYTKDRKVLCRYPSGRTDAYYEIPDGVTGISNNAFYYSENLTGIKFPDSLTSIGSVAFFRCSGLTDLIIPSSVTGIGDSAFEHCNGLTNVMILGALDIGERAFAFCSNMKSIVISDSLSYVGPSAFLSCSSLTDVYYTESKGYWSRINIEYQNEWLKTYPTIHFNYRFMTTDNAKYANNSIRVNATVYDWLVAQDGIIILAVYQSDRLVAVHHVDISASIDYTFNNIPAGDGYTVKMFAWKDLSGIEPICRESQEGVVTQ